jgi:hypothetical protein
MTLDRSSTQDQVDEAIANLSGPPLDESRYAGGISGWKLPGQTGELGTIGVRVDDKHRQDLAFRFFGSASDAEDFTRRAHYFVRATGELLVELNGDPLLADRPDEVRVETWFVDDDGRARFLGRPAAGARTASDLDQADAEARRRAEDEAAAEAKWLASQPRRPLTLADRDKQDHPTLRAAVRTFTAMGGTLEVGAYGELVLNVPERLIRQTADNELMYGMLESDARATCIAAAAEIAKAERVIIAALNTRKQRQSLVDVVPDAPVTFAGGVAS